MNTSSSYKSNIIKPTYKTQFVKNREYDGITRTNPKQLRFRIPSSSSSYSRGLFNFFDKSNNNRNLFKFYDKKNNNNNNNKLKRQIQSKYKEKGVTDEYLFKYFKQRDPYDQINLNRFMNKYIPPYMRKKTNKPSSFFQSFFKGKSNNNKKSEPAQVKLEPSNSKKTEPVEVTNKKPGFSFPSLFTRKSSNSKKTEPVEVTNKKPGFSFPSMFKKTPSCFNKINKSKINSTIVRQQYISRKNDPNIYKKLYKEYTGEDNCTNENINKFKSFVGIPYIPISTPNIDKNTDLSNILAKLEKLKEQI